MSYDEMCEAIYKVKNDMFDVCQIPCKVIVNKKHKRYMLDTHKLYTGSDKVETIFGVPLEFGDLPDNLNFIVLPDNLNVSFEAAVAENEDENESI